MNQVLNLYSDILSIHLSHFKCLAITWLQENSYPINGTNTEKEAYESLRQVQLNALVLMVDRSKKDYMYSSQQFVRSSMDIPEQNNTGNL